MKITKLRKFLSHEIMIWTSNYESCEKSNQTSIDWVIEKFWTQLQSSSESSRFSIDWVKKLNEHSSSFLENFPLYIFFAEISKSDVWFIKVYKLFNEKFDVKNHVSFWWFADQEKILNEVNLGNKLQCYWNVWERLNITNIVRCKCSQLRTSSYI